MRWDDLLWTAATGFMGCALIVAAVLLAGCEAGNGGNRAAREISLAEFSRPADRVNRMEPTEVERVADSERDSTASEVRPSGGAVANPRPLPQLGAGPAESEEMRRGPEPGTRIIVDSLVGQVNGRPIYADSFFQPIKDQLRAIARRSTQREFFDQANEVISQHLWQIIQNELILADARSQLSQQQQQGLFAWMRAMREQEILRGGGTQTAAARRLEEQHGMTMDEFLAARRDYALMHKLKEERINPRVIVSWRDIEREYQRRFHEFNPPARMKVSRIRLSTERDAELIGTVKQMLDDRVEFPEVAAAAGTTDGGTWQVFQIGEEGVDGLQLSESIKQHLRDLSVGKTSEPFEIGASTWWLHVAEIDQPKGRSLYDPDVQRMLHDRIFQRRFNEELGRYMDSLFAPGVRDELDRMRERLLVIAFERYGPR